MNKNFKNSYARVKVYEGGKVDDPDDPGGRTAYGVIQRVYDAYRDRKGLPRRDVWLITVPEREEIYRAQYWDAVQGDKLASGVDFVVFDGAVNSGPVQSIKWLQRGLAEQGVYSGGIDGHIGQMTLAGIEELADHDELIASICAHRLAFLKRLKTWWKYKGGWSARVAQTLAVGQAWARGSIGPKVEPVEEHGKGELEDAVKAPTTMVADGATASGLSTTTIGATLDTAKDQLVPYGGTNRWVDYAITGLIVLGVLLTVGGLAYRFVVKRRREERAEALSLQAAS